MILISDHPAISSSGQRPGQQSNEAVPLGPKASLPSAGFSERFYRALDPRNVELNGDRTFVVGRCAHQESALPRFFQRLHKRRNSSSRSPRSSQRKERASRRRTARSPSRSSLSLTTSAILRL